MSLKILENVYSKKDTYIYQHFCGPEHEQHDKNGRDSPSNPLQDSPHADDHQPLETKVVDIKALMNQPIAERAETFYDTAKTDQWQALLESTKPWKKDPNYFQTVHVSSLALLKMTMHAKSGGSIEIMGMLTGKLVKNGIIVMDVYPLPVEGTETRVNAQAEGYEFMVQYLDNLRKSGRNENIVGWYHSHPGYGCWLSGIDVNTQALNQQFQDPYLAIVIDPMRTISNGLVEIGAFRTYTEEYAKARTQTNVGSFGSATPANKKTGREVVKKGVKAAAQNIPESKIKDFGMHSSRYYSLGMEIFRSNVDHMILSNLWNKFWISTLVGDQEDQRQEVERFLNEKLTELEKKMEGMKKLECPGPSSQQTTNRPKRTVPSLREAPSMASRLAQPDSSSSASTSVSNVFGGSLMKSLSPFTKANFINRAKKEKELMSDGSDSEMNDWDSDIEMRQYTDDDRLEQTREMFSTRAQYGRGANKTRRQRHAMQMSPSQHDSLVEMTGLRKKKKDDVMRATAAEASRNLANLKIQEIIFLNE